MNNLKNLSVRRKIIVAASATWIMISFILSLYITDNRSEESFLNYILTFLTSFLILNIPTWLYWIAFWIWGETANRFVNNLIVNSSKKLIDFIKLNNFGIWFFSAMFLALITDYCFSIYRLNFYLVKDSQVLTILVGESLGLVALSVFYKILKCNNSVYKKRFKIFLSLWILLVMLPYQGHHVFKSTKEDGIRFMESLNSNSNPTSRFSLIYENQLSLKEQSRAKQIDYKLDFFSKIPGHIAGKLPLIFHIIPSSISGSVIGGGIGFAICRTPCAAIGIKLGMGLGAAYYTARYEMALASAEFDKNEFFIKMKSSGLLFN